MENNLFEFDPDKVQPLEDWVTEVTGPIMDAIGAVSEALEMLYQELK